MKVTRTGDWASARKTLSTMPLNFKSAVELTLRQEAEALRNEVIEGIRTQSPAGQRFRDLSPLTIAAREMRRFGGTKALIDRGDLRNSISAVVRGHEAFVGVLRKARSKKGRPLVDIAQLNEFGSDPIMIPMTPKVRSFLFALLKKAGVPRRGGSGKGFIVMRIPPRPFLRPVFERYEKVAGQQFLGRIARRIGFG